MDEADGLRQIGRTRHQTARGKQFKIELMQNELKRKRKKLKTVIESVSVESRAKSMQSERSILEAVQSMRLELSDTWAQLGHFATDIKPEDYEEMKKAMESDLEAALKLECNLEEWINSHLDETMAKEKEADHELNNVLQLQTTVDKSIKDAFQQYETASNKSGRTHLSRVKDEGRSIRSFKSNKSNQSQVQ